MKRSLAATLRRKIKASRLSSRALAEQIEIPHATITEFLRGKDIRLRTAQKLCDYFGLELKPKARKRR